MKQSGSANGHLLWDTLHHLGIDMVFGLPGTQTVGLYRYLSESRVRHILTTTELAAAFMACGYYRASGKPAAVTTIPGPGFTFALTGMAEARHDSIPVIHVVVQKSHLPGKAFQFQRLDRVAMGTSVYKAVFEADTSDELARTVVAAYQTAMAGEPGPVMLQVANGILQEAAKSVAVDADAGIVEAPKGGAFDTVAERVSHASRIVLLLGQGVVGGGSQVYELVQRWECPVLTTTSARGIIPENSPYLIAADYGMGGVKAVNDLVERADMVLALGCKFSHNGSAGFRLRLPEDRLVHVDSSAEVLNANYPAQLAVEADAPGMIEHLLKLDYSPGGDWAIEELAKARTAAAVELIERLGESPTVDIDPEKTLSGFFEVLEKTLPPEAIVVTDSGFHEMATRALLSIRNVRGLIVPSDYQSMGFGLPAAIGAGLATGRPVVVIIGDGGLSMLGMEIMTAVREQIDLKIILFNDRSLGLIKRQQLARSEEPFAVDLSSPDWAAWANSLGTDYMSASANLEHGLKEAFASEGVLLYELPLKGPRPATLAPLKRGLMRAVRRVVGNSTVDRIKRWLGRD